MHNTMQWTNISIAREPERREIEHPELVKDINIHMSKAQKTRLTQNHAKTLTSNLKRLRLNVTKLREATHTNQTSHQKLRRPECSGPMSP